MTDPNRGGTPADAQNPDRELDERWETLRDGLATYLATMVDPDEEDHLILKVPDGTPGQGASPYVQFAAFGDGRMLRAEVCSNRYLAAPFTLDPADVEVLALVGEWQGGEDDNFYLERPVHYCHELAAAAMVALRSVYAIPDPGLLSVQAWGPAAAGVGVLGLAHLVEEPSEDPLDLVDVDEYIGPPAGWATSELAVVAANHAELVGFVRDVMVEMFDPEPEIDVDGDFVLVHLGQPVWVRARSDQPAVEIMARVAHDVRSRRATAVEISLLNRDHTWVKWTLREREVWQTLLLPARPFVATHVSNMIAVFLDSMGQTRDDLAYRTGARVA